MDLDAAFASIAPPEADHASPFYAVTPVTGFVSYLVGKDETSRACLLVATGENVGEVQPAIRLETLDVQFDLRCKLTKSGEAREGVFTVIRCRALDRETIRYFLSVCQTITTMLGDRPRRSHVASAVNRLIAIFRCAQSAPARTVNGLFGELFVISRSRDALKTVAGWRIDEAARFDFASGDVRLDVKACAGRLRTHVFSFEQCNPPPGTVAVVASLFAERLSRGVSLQSLIERIEDRLRGNAELVLKLREVVVSTLGNSLSEGLTAAFDLNLAGSSLRFFLASEVPAIRGVLPSGVGDVHFTSDLSALRGEATLSLAALSADLSDLVPDDL